MKRNIFSNVGTKSGIYTITNLINGDYYLGSTNNLSSRYRTHLSALKKGKSACIILQNAVNKYGIENFEYSVLEVTSSYKEREIQLLKLSLPKYNAIKETEIRREISKETRTKMSIAQKNSFINGRKPTSLKGMKFNREVKSSVLLTSNDEIKEFTSVENCSKEFNCTPHAIYQAFYRGTKLKKKYKVVIKEFQK